MEEIGGVLKEVVEASREKKAENLVVLDLKGLSDIAEFFVILSGKSNIHVQSIYEGIVKRVEEKLGIRPDHVEGLRLGRWILLDYGDVVVHIFYKEFREYYDLEGLWIDAKRIKIDLGEDYESEEEF